MKGVVDSALLDIFLSHIVLDLSFFELNSSSHLVYFHVEYLVGGLALTFDNFELLPMIRYFMDNVV